MRKNSRLNQWGQSPLSHIFRVGSRSAGDSPDGDAFPYQRVKSGGIPVRKADAAMASGAADGFGDGAAVDADAGAVQSSSEDADGAGGKVVEVIGALPALRGFTFPQIQLLKTQ